MNRTFLPIAVVFSGSTLLLIDSTINAALLLLVAGLVAFMLRRDSAATRHLIWLVAIVAMLAVPVFSAILPQWRVLPAWAVIGDQPDERNGSEGNDARYGSNETHTSHLFQTSHQSPAIALQPKVAGTTPRNPDAEITTALADQSVVPLAIVPTPWTWRIAVPAVWAAGFIVLMLRLIAARIVLWKTECRATRLQWDGLLRPSLNSSIEHSKALEGHAAELQDPIIAAMESACSQLGIYRPVQLLIHSEPTIPVVWGIFRHWLLLPALARQWRGEQLRSVLLHELSHIKRRDTLVQFLAQIACALHWFNPLVWFAAWRLHVERERACDDFVLASGVRASAYAEHLLNVATRLSSSPLSQACGLAMARSSSLHGRLTAVLSEKQNRRTVTGTILLYSLLAGAGIAAPIAMLRAADQPDPVTSEVSAQEPAMPTTQGATLQPATEQKLKWGEPANGLRMALAWPPTLDEPGMGDAPEFTLVVQNVSEAAVRLTASDAAPNPRRLMMRDKGSPLQGLRDPTTMPGDWLLQPREVAFVRMFQKEQEGRITSATIEDNIRVFPHYSMTAEMSIEKAPAGAWTGKLSTGETRGSVDVIPPKDKDAQALFESWTTAARADGKIPGALIGQLLESVKTFIKNNPTWETTPRLQKMLPRFNEFHDWIGQDAVALLAELAALQSTPISMALDRDRERTIVIGTPLPSKLANAPWGETLANGLRVAYLLEPRLAEHRLNTPLSGRILIHNAGKEPVVFRTRGWHQLGHTARDAKGADINVEATDWMTRGQLTPFRLAPGEFVELNTTGIGVGANKNEDDWQNTRVGSWLDVKPGDDVTVTTGAVPLNDWNEDEQLKADGEPRWWLDFISARLSRHLPFPADKDGREGLLYRVAMELFGTPVSEETNAAFVADTTPTALDSLALRLFHRPGQHAWAGPLTSGPTKFRVLPADPDAAKKPRTANNPGRYTLGQNILFVVSRRPIGDRIVNEADITLHRLARDNIFNKVTLPDGYDTWAAAWIPGSTVLWVQQENGFRRYDFSTPEKVKEEAVEPDEVPAEIRTVLPAVLAEPEPPKPPAAAPATEANADSEKQFPPNGDAVPSEDSGQLPKHEYAQSLFRKWQANTRTDGKMPGALIGHVAKTLDDFVKQYPENEATPKLAALRPKFDASHDWEPAAIIALLDEVTAISTAPVSWADIPMESSEMWTVRQGEALPIELKSAAWGEPAENGLRAAWLLEPRAEQYPLGTVLKVRVLFNNTGTKPVIFKTESWHQDDRHSARDANGSAIIVGSTFYTGSTPMATYRLVPGEYVEVPGHGIAIGAGEYIEERSTGRVGAWIEAKEGDEVRFSSSVDASREGWTGLDDPKDPVELWKLVVRKRVEREAPLPSMAADRELLLRRVTQALFGELPTTEERASFLADNAADALETLVTRLQARPRIEPYAGKLPTGEIRFRVIAADPNAAKAPRTANDPGLYVLGDSVHLRVRQTSVYPFRVGSRPFLQNKATIVFLSLDPRVASPHEPFEIALPNGNGTYAFAWDRGAGVVWLIEEGIVRSYDFTNPSQVQELRMVPGSLINVPEHMREPLGESRTLLNPPAEQ